MAQMALSESCLENGSDGEGRLSDLRRRTHSRGNAVYSRHTQGLQHQGYLLHGGRQRQEIPELFERIKADGHQVGNHTHNHLGAFKHWASTYLINVHKANRLIHAHLFRPPHGIMRWSEYYWLRKKYRIIMWDLVTRDYSKWLTAEDVLDNVKRYARNGSIITFHDSLKSID